MKKIFLFIITCFSLLCSCGKEEEKNSDIEWQFDKPYSSKYHFEVPSDGESYNMICKNYLKVSMDMVEEKDTVILWNEPKTTLKRDWYTINLVDSKTIKVTFSSNDSDSDRSLAIHANAFNSSDVISFSQKGKKE